MKQQIVSIHGGGTFETYEDYLNDLNSWELTLDRLRHKGWKDNLQTELGSEYDVLLPKFPNASNARYSEWKIYFEKLIPLVNEDVIYIGHSLGGVFLAKYLSENIYPEHIKATMFVSAPHSDESKYSLVDFKLINGLEKLSEQGGKLFFIIAKTTL